MKQQDKLCERPIEPGNAGGTIDSSATGEQTNKPMPGQAEEQGATTFEDISAATQGGTLISIPSHVPSTTDTKRASQTIQIGRGDNLKTLYRYSPLPGLKAIRLLRLLPHQKENASIECELFDYPLTGPGEGPHLYEALSYAWGSQYKPYSISINSSKFPVTANLYTALLRLRDRFIVRILWVDAICIDQHNEIEKAEQVQYMAEIFSKASRVVVWLGEAENDGERALEEIRFAADEESTERLVDGSTKQAILALLQRPWFERIWVLQETAAARNVIIKCGSAEIDGYAFCVGLNSRSLNLLYRDSPDLQSLISSIIYLIKGATFRPKRVPRSSGGFSLHIRPLSDLIEMFHTRKATIPHDKVIALLGMSSDDPTAAGLSPDYKIPWEKLLERLIKFLLGGEVLVKTWDKTEMAVVKSKGYILGKVFSSEDKGPNDRRRVVVTIKDSSGNMSLKREWTLPASVKTIQSGDLVCFLHGAPKPTIIRPYRDHFSIIFVSVTPLENTGEKHNNILSPEHPSTLRDFSLVWDWGQVQETTLDREDREEYDTQIGSRVFENAKTEAGDHLEKIIRLLNTAKILQDAEEHKKAGERLRDILEGYEEEFGKNDLCILECKERLAQIYKKTRQWKEATELFEQVIHSRKQVQGLDHEDTIRSISDLAALYRNQGDLELLRSENLTTSQMMAMLNQSDVDEFYLDLSGVDTTQHILSDFVKSLLGRIRTTNGFQFETILRYVLVPELGAQDALLGGSMRADHEEVKDIFAMLKVMKVKEVLVLLVSDRLRNPHSDDAVAECVNGYKIKVLNWKKLDLYLGNFTDKNHLQELHLYSGGNRSVHEQWYRELVLFPNLKKLFVYVIEVQDVLSKTRAEAVQEELQKGLAHIRKNLEGRQEKAKLTSQNGQEDAACPVRVIIRPWNSDRGVENVSEP